MSTGHVFGGTQPYEEVRWDLVPGHTAIVVIDPQNDFLHDEGWYARQGIDIAHMRRCIEPIKALVARVFPGTVTGFPRLSRRVVLRSAFFAVGRGGRGASVGTRIR